MPRPMTKREKLAQNRMALLMHRMDMEADPSRWLTEFRRRFPAEWRTLEDDVWSDPPKEKVTLYLDRAVAKAFKSMGRGWQARVNRVLETWLQAQILGWLEDERAVDAFLDAAEVALPARLAERGLE